VFYEPIRYWIILWHYNSNYIINSSSILINYHFRNYYFGKLPFLDITVVGNYYFGKLPFGYHHCRKLLFWDITVVGIFLFENFPFWDITICRNWLLEMCFWKWPFWKWPFWKWPFGNDHFGNDHFGNDHFGNDHFGNDHFEMFIFQKFPFLDISMLDVGVRANSKVDFITYLSNIPSNTIGGMLVVCQCKSQLHSGFCTPPLQRTPQYHWWCIGGTSM